MSATPLSQDAPVARVGTARALARLIEYARPALPAIIAGMVAALLSQLVALAIPQVLQSIVDGPLADVRDPTASRVRETTTQEDTMQTDSYARWIAVDGAARPALLAQGFTG